VPDLISHLIYSDKVQTRYQVIGLRKISCFVNLIHFAQSSKMGDD